MEYNNIDILSLLISATALIFSLAFGIKNYSLVRRQIQDLDNSNAPNPQIQEIKFYKSNPNVTDLTAENYCRIAVDRPQIPNKILTLNGRIKTFYSEQINDGQVKAFISECNNNKNSVYLTYLYDTPHICCNHSSQNNYSFIIEYSNVIISLHNFGAIASAFRVNSIDITLSENHSISILGKENNIISITPDQNKTLTLVFDEVVEDVNDSICGMTEVQYDSLPDGDSYNILYYRLSGKIIKYHKLKLKCTFWNAFNVPYEYIFILENNGDYFTTKTIRL